jgi:hypothetical protein
MAGARIRTPARDRLSQLNLRTRARGGERGVRLPAEDRWQGAGVLEELPSS